MVKKTLKNKFLFGILVMFICSNADSDKKPENPHTNPSQCSACHTSTSHSKQDLATGGDVTKLCVSCHNGQRALREVHPFGTRPTGEFKKRIPAQFPLTRGRLTCLSCHDISSQCESTKGESLKNNNFLRGKTQWNVFCFQCHNKEKYSLFNAHDQLDANGKPKEKTCLWCHKEVPEVSSQMRPSSFFGLRSESHLICRNCHSIGDSHPVDGKHIFNTPTDQTIKCMAKYVGVSPSRYKTFQVFPVDESGRISCFSCHNPHEKGLFSEYNPRSLGADHKLSQYTRLRRRIEDEQSCVTCHLY